MSLTKYYFLSVFSLLFLISGCGGGGEAADQPVTPAPTPAPIPETDNGIPVVKEIGTYSVVLDEDITYANGLAVDNSNSDPFAIPLKLDVYYPENDASTRPVFMFIHGGGFTGGTKTKPEIVEMGNFYASRGWVFVSIDYRTTEELGSLQGLSQQDVMARYRGLAPQEWIEYGIQGAEKTKELQQSVAMYMAQRDAKAALRWIVANSNIYEIDTDLITVGGASAGAVTAIALGISNLESFKDEISVTDDPTLSSTNLNEAYEVKSMVYFWGSNVKLELYEAVYGFDQYDVHDPELFMAHGTNDQNPGTPFSEATELQGIYDSLSIYNAIVPLEGKGHGAWDAKVDGEGLFDLSFDFIVDRQNLTVE